MTSNFIIKAWLIGEMPYYDHLPDYGNFNYLYQKTINYFEGSIKGAMATAEKLIIVDQLKCKALKIIHLMHHNLIIGATVEHSDYKVNWVYPDQSQSAVENKIQALQQRYIEAIKTDSFETYIELRHQIEVLNFQRSDYYQYTSEDLPRKNLHCA